MKVITILFVLSLSLSIMAQTTAKNQIENLNKTKQRLESTIKVKQDSLKLIIQQIDNLSREELFTKMKMQPEGMVFKATIKFPGKIRKENAPNSVVLSEVNKSDTVLLTDFNDNYWIVNKGKFFGYIHEMYLNVTPELNTFKNAVIERNEKMRQRVEEEKRQNELRVKEEKRKNELRIEEITRKNDIAALKKYEEDQRIKREERRNYLLKKYGKEDGEKLNSGYFWIGMTSEMAIESLGRPETINKSVGSWGVSEQWVYYNDYLYFENGILTSYQTSR